MLDLAPKTKTALRLLALLASVPLLLQATSPRPACAGRTPAASEAPAAAMLAR